MFVVGAAFQEIRRNKGNNQITNGGPSRRFQIENRSKLQLRTPNFARAVTDQENTNLAAGGQYAAILCLDVICLYSVQCI